MKKTAILTSFMIGFLSLGQEILWIRIVSFSAYSVPHAFAYTLFLYLLGIAIGAWFGRKICKKNKLTFDLLGSIFFLISLFNLLALWLVYLSVDQGLMWLVLTSVIIACSALHGVIFPIAHHLGAEKEKTGASISNVYFANVLGCTISPILIGFFLLDYLTIQQAFLCLAAITFLTAAVLFNKKILKSCALSISLLTMAAAVYIPEKIIRELSKNSYQLDTYPTKIIEGRYGVIQVYELGDKKHNVVYGANVYDGKTNTSLVNNTNGIDRPYVLAASKINAKKVLVIGLSTGSWVKVLSSLPELESMTVIEINPDYIELVAAYPEVSSILKDPRIHIQIGDGRKWLNTHKEKDFDIVLMNTTWHWRSYASSLLSIDFLRLIEKKMSNHAVLMYNTTGSLDAFYTADQVFPQVYRYKNMVIATKSKDSAIDINTPSLRNRLKLLKYPESAEFLFADTVDLSTAVQEISKNKLIPSSQIDYSSLGRKPEAITDVNMITEFKYGKGLSF